MSLLQSMTGLTGVKLTDPLLASDMLALGKLACISLTMATLEAATPELRTALQESLNECLHEHQQLAELAARRGWYRPHASPEEQLQLTLELSAPAAGPAEA